MKVIFGRFAELKKQEIVFCKYDENKFFSFDVNKEYAIVKCDDKPRLFCVFGNGEYKDESCSTINNEVIKFIDLGDDNV